MESTPLAFRHAFSPLGSRELRLTECGEELVERHVFEISRLAHGTGLKLAGDLDLHSAPQLTAALSAFQKSGDVCLDMTEVTFIDSSGLSSILSFACSTERNGKVLIVDSAAVIGPVFNIIAIDDHTSVEVRHALAV